MSLESRLVAAFEAVGADVKALQMAGGGGGPTLQGDPAPYITQTKTYQITNYNSFSSYDVSASAGVASLSGDTITFTAPASAGNVSLSLTVDGQPTVFTVAVQAVGVAAPTNTRPADGEVNTSVTPILQSSAFVLYGQTDEHLASRWTLYQGGTQVHSSGWRTDALTSYTVPLGVLASSMPYTWTVEHQGTTLGDSQPSVATAFSTAAAFAGSSGTVGPGFLAGEAPDGLTTTIAGTPTSASVRVYWRDPADPQAPDVLVASTQSAADGTWQIAGLNPALRYVVRAQKSQFDDVTVVGAAPSRSDVIAYVDHLGPTEEFDGLTGYVLLDSGLPPFTCQVIEPLPYGLSARIEGRKLLIEGVSSDAGLWESVVRVTASNGVWADVPVQVRIAWTPSSLTVAPKIWLDDKSAVTVDSGVVSSWANSKGSLGGAFTQNISSHSPALVTSSLEGRRVIQFDGVDDNLGAPIGSLFRSQSIGWCLSVVRKMTVDSSAAERIIFYASAGVGPNRFSVRLGGAVSNPSVNGANLPSLAVRRLDSDGTKAIAAITPRPQEWVIMRSVVNWGVGAASIHVNAVLEAHDPKITSSGLTSNSGSSFIGIGGQDGGGGKPDMQLAALIVGSGSAPSDDEWMKLEGWAAHRYGLTDLLPADHPYKEVAP